MIPKPEVLNLLEKLQNFTSNEVDEERGSFKIGDSVIYDMFGGVLSNSDFIRTLGIKEHTLRISHNGAVAKITETAGEEVSRYNIVFEDGFTIKDVATSELKAPEPLGIQPKPQEEPNLEAEELHLEDYSKDDLEKVKSKSVKTGDAIRKVEDDELRIAPDKVKKESKLIEQEEDEMSFREVKAETISAIKNMRKRTNEWSVRDSLKKFTSWGFWKKGEKALIDIKTANEIADELLDYIQMTPQEQDVYDANDIVEAVKEDELKEQDEHKTFLDIRNVEGLEVNRLKRGLEKLGLKFGKDYFIQSGGRTCWILNMVYDNEVSDLFDEYNVEEAESPYESKLAEEETEFTPSRAEFKKIGDEKLRLLLKNARRSQDYWQKEKAHPEKVSAASAAVVRYEEEMVNRGLMSASGSEKKESKFSFIQKQEPLWLCNECYSTYRSNEVICAVCESTEVERILEQSKEVFQVTWTNTDTGKEESTRVMAYDKTDAKREAKRSNREITKVKGPITEEPKKEEAKVPFDQDKEGNLKEREQKVTEDEPITTIEIVTSKVDPEAYNIRVVQLPEGSIVILDSVSDREVAMERGKKFARDLNAKFLGIIDEKKIEEDKARRKIELEKLGVGQLKDLWLKKVSPVPGFGKESPKEKGILINHILGVEFRKKWESKLKEQEEDTFTTLAKGIEDKETADKLAAEKEGQVVVDDEDDKKFAVLVRKE